MEIKSLDLEQTPADAGLRIAGHNSGDGRMLSSA
jgi:hypothetical protein